MKQNLLFYNLGLMVVWVATIGSLIIAVQLIY